MPRRAIERQARREFERKGPQSRRPNSAKMITSRLPYLRTVGSRAAATRYDETTRRTESSRWEEGGRKPGAFRRSSGKEEGNLSPFDVSAKAMTIDDRRFRRFPASACSHFFRLTYAALLPTHYVVCIPPIYRDWHAVFRKPAPLRRGDNVIASKPRRTMTLKSSRSVFFFFLLNQLILRFP